MAILRVDRATGFSDKRAYQTAINPFTAAVFYEK